MFDIFEILSEQVEIDDQTNLGLVSETVRIGTALFETQTNSFLLGCGME